MTSSSTLRDHQQIRLSFVAFSGSGKSSVVNRLAKGLQAKGLSVSILKLASPLYRLQQDFYNVVGRRLNGDHQDQILMENIATQLRRIDPEVLVNDFQRRVNQCQSDVILNDDLRDDHIDAKRLRQLGFRFIRVAAPETVRLSRLRSRNDPSIVEDSPLDRQISRIPAEFIIPNAAQGLEVLNRQVDVLTRYFADLPKPRKTIA